MYICNFNFFQDRNSQKLQRHLPARAISISFQFVDSIFVENSQKAMSITSCGNVIIWSDTLTPPDIPDCITTATPMVSVFKKEFIKSVKVGEVALRVIKSVDGFVMISDILGHIRFYDGELKILFWCPSHDSIDSYITISFDLKWKRNKPDPSDDKTFSIRDFFVRKSFFLTL